jgi:hypothetical protein
VSEIYKNMNIKELLLKNQTLQNLPFLCHKLRFNAFNFYCFISIHLDDNLIRYLNQKVVNVIQKCTIPLIQRWKIWTDIIDSGFGNSFA